MKKNNKSLIFVLTAILVLIIAVEVSVADISNCPSGMVSYWKFDGSLTDELGIYDGTMGSYGSYADGNINQGLYGAKGCSNPFAAKVDNFPNLDSFTIESWIKPACPPGSWQGSLTISKHDDMGGYNGVGYVLFTTPDPYGGSNYKFQLQNFDMINGQSIGQGMSSPLTYPCNSWSHVVLSRDRGNEFKLFVNGEEVASILDNVVGSLANNEPLVFHGFTSGGCGWGMSAITMDEVAIYDRVLSNDEIQQHYQNGLNGGVYCIDSDGDGTPDSEEGCPDDADKTALGICGCGVSDVDTDNDGTADCNDNCPFTQNLEQEDEDLDGLGDACFDDKSYIVVDDEWAEGYELYDKIEGIDYYYGWNAFSTILDALEDLDNYGVSGSTVYVFNGDYEGCFSLEEEGLSLVGEDKEFTIIDGFYCEDEEDTISVESEDISIDGFTIRNNNDEWIQDEASAVRIEGSNVDINNVIIEGEGNYYGIYIDSVYTEEGEGSVITNSAISNACSGIYITESPNILIQGNVIDFNGIKGSCGEVTTGIDIDDSDNVNIQDNEIINNDVGVHVDPDGGCSSDVVITKNKITGNDGFAETEGYGIIAEGCEDELEIEESEENEDAEEELDYSVEARLNWWGDASGPEAKDNPAGTGDRVEGDRVKYSPWYTSEEMVELRGVPDEGNSLTLPEATTINQNGITVFLPEDIIITGEEDWTGYINAPTIKDIIPPEFATDPGYTGDVDQVIEIGFPDVKLTFSRAVKVLIPNAAGKLVGYARTGEPFHPITTVCGGNNQGWADDNLVDGIEDCKIDEGDDLVVWTKHFTEFVTYTQTPVTSSGATSSGSSVGGSDSKKWKSISPVCEYTCGEWGVCVDGKQKRECTLTVTQNCVGTGPKPETEKGCQVETSSNTQESNVGTGKQSETTTEGNTPTGLAVAPTSGEGIITDWLRIIEGWLASIFAAIFG